MDLIRQIDDFFDGELRDNSFFSIYSFTNENINGYLPFFDLKGKSLLTVGSSGDQTINANLAGCDNITVYDICPLSKAYFYLKMASMLCLDREEFTDFLCDNKYDDIGIGLINPKFLNINTFNRIKNVLKSLDYESFCIWEHLLNHYGGIDIYRLFRRDINEFKSTINCNRYLKNDYNYLQARKRIHNLLVNFITGNIVEPQTDRKFHNIWLSNVAHSIPKEKRIPMLENNSKILTPDGKMLVCYYWNTSMTVKGYKIKEFKNPEIIQRIIPGTSKESANNSIQLYEKSNGHHL